MEALAQRFIEERARRGAHGRGRRVPHDLRRLAVRFATRWIAEGGSTSAASRRQGADLRHDPVAGAAPIHNRRPVGIDNGRSERLLRLVALGRKNWLFAGNDDGGSRAANLYTQTGTCHFHHLNPLEYLRWLFTDLPGLPPSRLIEASPLAWAAQMGHESPLVPDR